MSFAIMRHAKIKTWAKLRLVGAHNERRRETPNADRERPPEVLVGTGDAEADVRARIVGAGLDPGRLRKNGVLAVEVILGASPEFFRPGRAHVAGAYDPDRLIAWRDATVRFMREKWGDNLVELTLHTCETTPHAHAILCCIDTKARKKGAAVRLNAARWFDGPAKLRKLQDEYAAAMAPLGLQRGIAGSKAKHQDIARQYSTLHGEVTVAEEASRVAVLKLGEAELERRMAIDGRQRAAALRIGLEAFSDGRIIAAVGNESQPEFELAPMSPTDRDQLRKGMRPAWLDCWRVVRRLSVLVEERTQAAIKKAMVLVAAQVEAAREVFERAQALGSTLAPAVRAQATGLAAALNKTARSRPARQRDLAD
jgi:hypothetical protein